MPSSTSNAVVLRPERALLGPDLISVERPAILIEDGRISAVDPAPDATSKRIELPGTTLLPGFIDAHVHMGFCRPQDVLHGGVTTVRDLAWPADEIFPLVWRSEQPGFRGPRILAAGQMLTVPGGYPTRAAWAPPGTGLVLHDAEAAVAAVHDMGERGAAVIKVALNPEAGVSMDLDLLRTVVDTAHARGLEVTGHVYGLDELHKALDAGMDELAHMLMSDEAIPSETLDRMIAGDMAIVPTLAIRSGRGLETAIANLARFSTGGGRVVYGTDLGNDGPRPGIDRGEIDGMRRAGMDWRAIVASATTGAAAHLRLDDRGAISPGLVADLVGVAGDPAEDVAALGRVGFVIRGGRVYRNETESGSG